MSGSRGGGGAGQDETERLGVPCNKISPHSIPAEPGASCSQCSLPACSGTSWLSTKYPWHKVTSSTAQSRECTLGVRTEPCCGLLDKKCSKINFGIKHSCKNGLFVRKKIFKKEKQILDLYRFVFF